MINSDADPHDVQSCRPIHRRHLLLGSDAVRLVEEKIKSLQADFEAWKSVSLSTDVA
jgi:hypothetical protein